MRSSRALVALSFTFLMVSGGTALSQTLPHAPVCADRSDGTFSCAAHVIVDGHGKPAFVPQPKRGAQAKAPYGPAQFLGAYNLTGRANSGPPIIAIVDAFDHPTISEDLAVYSNQYGLPPLPDCPRRGITSSAVPCFQKVDQKGGQHYPKPNSGWALEIDLDVQIAHAICQNCSILLVEADDNSYANMMAAENFAVTSGAAVVSNSWSSGEFSAETFLDPYFAYQGVAVLFASGDSGYGPQYPAASQYATAVGGTTLLLNPDNSYKSEAAWVGAGSGCSLYEAKPPWQPDTGCPNRTIADVAAVADPATGAAVYSSQFRSTPGWFQVGGTSLATPLVAAIYALSGNLPPNVWGSELPYMNPLSLHDVTSGSNGSCGALLDTTYYLCHGVTGYDGPTGLGTPNGTGAF
jgi:subtilase family serine protease